MHTYETICNYYFLLVFQNKVKLSNLLKFSFLVVYQAFDSLLHKLHKYVPFGSSVADLYGGAGVIGLSLAVTRKCR